MRKLLFFLVFISGFVRAGGIYESMRLWESSKPESYSYELKIGGVFGYTLYKIVVKNGVCEAKSEYVLKRKPWFWKKDSCKDVDISDLFEAVERQAEHGAVEQNITFDRDYGYISTYSVVTDTVYADQDWYFQVTDFKLG